MVIYHIKAVYIIFPVFKMAILNYHSKEKADCLVVYPSNNRLQSWSLCNRKFVNNVGQWYQVSVPYIPDWGQPGPSELVVIQSWLQQYDARAVRQMMF